MANADRLMDDTTTDDTDDEIPEETFMETETVDDETADDETVDDETADDELTDGETADDETANKEPTDGETSGDPTDRSTTARGGDREKPVVLAVDDEQRITQAFELWLADDYQVRTATSGEEALEKFDEAVDVVLLDRQMPGLSGEEVLERIRDRGYDCQVAMITGIDPDFDIVQMPFDDYVTKPVGQDELQVVVDRLLSVRNYDDRLQEYYATAEKEAMLETEKPRTELDSSEEYASLVEHRQQLQDEVDELIVEMDPEQVTDVLRQLPDDEEMATE